MRRGDIHLADLGEPIGHEQGMRRPVLVVSAQPRLESNPPIVTVLPLTRTYRERSTHVELDPGTSGLKATGYAKCEDIRAISPQRLGYYFGRAEDTALSKVDLILRRRLAL